MAYQSVNLNTGKVTKSFAHLNNEQRDQVVANAGHCFQSRKQTSFAQRAVNNRPEPDDVAQSPIGLEV